MTKKSTLVVFFEGTGNTLDPPTTQIGIFADAVQATLISSHKHVRSAMKRSSGPSARTLKMAFDGVAVTNGITGALFAAGIDEQVDEVVKAVRIMIDHNQCETLRVVAVGLSRGGISCFKLANKLAFNFSPENHTSVSVSLSMLVFDPVAGNAVWTGFPYTAALSQNLSKCHNLKRVLALYPYEPLPHIAMHAPTLAVYPTTTKVEEDVTLGCHQGALFGTKQYPRDDDEKASNLSFRRIYDYLESEGVNMNFYHGIYQPTAEECLAICQSSMEFPRKSRRIAHDKTGRNRTIIQRSKKEECRWLNKHHEELEYRINKTEVLEVVRSEKYQLDFQDGWKLFCT